MQKGNPSWLLRPSGLALTLLLFIVLVIMLALYAQRPPAAVAATAPPTVFSAERALAHLEVIAAEPHPLGTAANARVRDYLLGALEDLGLQAELQRATAVSARYRTAGVVENVLGRLPGRDNTGAILLVAHYDSVPTGPGASDNGAAVAAILEALRAVTSGPALRNDLLVLFSDGEEVGLLGAEAFAAEHPWMNEVALVLNLEARGTGGPSVLFETSPGNRWLMGEFARANPYPKASSLAFEIYNLLPNDTDFTVFKERGVLGLNAAFIERASYYHSALDDLERLDLRSLQHHGEHVLSVARHFGELELASVPREGNAVYFDLLGRWLVHYPAAWALPLALVAALLYLALLVYGLRRRLLHLGHVLLGVLGMLLAALVAFGLSWLAWEGLVRLYPDFRFLWMGHPYRSEVFTLGFALLASCGVTLVYLALRRLKPVNLLMGALLLWLLLLLPLSFYLPGGSYLLFWPLLVASLGLFFLFGQPDWLQPGLTRLLVLLVMALPPLLLLAPLIPLVLAGLGLELAPLVMILVALVLGMLTPQLELITRPKPYLLPALLGLAALLSFVAGAYLAQYREAQPRPNSLFYVLDAGRGEAIWASASAELDAWTRQFFTAPYPGRVTEMLPDAWDLRAASAPAVSLAGPELRLLEDAQDSGLRRFTLELQSRRGAPHLYLLVHPRVELAGARLDGQSLPRLDRPNGWARLVVHGGGDGVTLELVTPTPGGLELVLLDVAHDLLRLAELPVPPRPAGLAVAPSHFGDATLVRTDWRIGE